MKILLYFCVIIVCAAEETKQKCDGVEVNGQFRKNYVIGKGLNRPYHLAYYEPEDEIYFSQNIGSDKEDRFEIAVLKENATEPESVPEIKNGFALAIDSANHIGYFGGSDGVYKKVLNKNESIEQIVYEHNVWSMFFKKHLYYITYPSQRLYRYGKEDSGKVVKKDEKLEPVHETWMNSKVYQFAIDGDDDIFLTNATGLYMIEKGQTKMHHKWHLFEGETVFRSIAVNSKGEAHFCGRHRIYVPIKSNHTLQVIASVKNLFGITFDRKDMIIYSNPHQIVKLLPSMCHVMNKVPAKN